MRYVGSEPVKNRLLLELAEENFGMLQPRLERIVVSQRQILYDTGDPFAKTYFVESGLVSLLAKSADGVTIDVGLIGCEGMLGIAYLFAQKSALLRNLALPPCTLLSIDSEFCKPILDNCAMIQPILNRFFRFLLDQTTHIAACSSAHRLQQRLARWLLMASDRLGVDVVPMTQEFLAATLGVRRGGLTITAGELRGAGLIRYHHGEVTLLDREGLESVACECYRYNRISYAQV